MKNMMDRYGNKWDKAGKDGGKRKLLKYRKGNSNIC